MAAMSSKMREVFRWVDELHAPHPRHAICLVTHYFRQRIMIDLLLPEYTDSVCAMPRQSVF